MVKNWGNTSFTVEFFNRDGWSLESVFSLLEEMLGEFSPMLVAYNITFDVPLFKYSDRDGSLSALLQLLVVLWQKKDINAAKQNNSKRPI